MQKSEAPSGKPPSMSGVRDALTKLLAIQSSSLQSGIHFQGKNANSPSKVPKHGTSKILPIEKDSKKRPK